jgi:hypothetical protein
MDRSKLQSRQEDAFLEAIVELHSHAQSTRQLATVAVTYWLHTPAALTSVIQIGRSAPNSASAFFAAPAISPRA